MRNSSKDSKGQELFLAISAQVRRFALGDPKGQKLKLLRDWNLCKRPGTHSLNLEEAITNQKNSDLEFSLFLRIKRKVRSSTEYELHYLCRSLIFLCPAMLIISYPTFI